MERVEMLHLSPPNEKQKLFLQCRKKYIAFGDAFEAQFINQKENENRTIADTLDLGWRLVSMLPKSELDRIDKKLLDKYYIENTSGQEK